MLSPSISRRSLMHNLKNMSQSELVLVSCSICPRRKADSGTWKLSCIRSALVSCRCMFWDRSTLVTRHMGLQLWALRVAVCARMERRHNLGYELGYEVWTPSRMFLSAHGRRCWVVSASCTFSVARIALTYCMHERKLATVPASEYHC